MRAAARSLLYLSTAVLALAALAVVFHDALAHRITARLVQHISGIEVRFDGPFNLTGIFPLTLDASGVGITFTGGELTGSGAQIDTVHLQMRLLPLVRGVVHIERLLIADADVRISAARAAVPTKPPPTGVRVPIVESISLQRVRVRSRGEAGEQPHALTIANLQVGAREGGAVTAVGTADLDGNELELTVELGSVEQFLRPAAPFPIGATLRAPAWAMEASVKGTLAGPRSGRGARLDLQVTTSNVSPMRDILFPGAPITGSVDAKAHLSGDLNAPALSAISLTIEDEHRFRCSLSGSVSDLWAWDGLNLQINAVSLDPAATRYLTREAIPGVETLRFQGTVQGKANDYLLEAVDLELSGENELSVAARGSLHLLDLDSKWPVGNSRLDLQVTAATSALAAWMPQNVPRTGGLQLRTRLESTVDSLTFSDLELELRETSPVSGKINGGFAYTIAQVEAIRTQSEPGLEAVLPADLDVSVDLATADLPSVSTLLDQTLPDLGALSAKAQLRRDGNKLRVTDMDAQTTGKHPLSLAVQGQLTIADIATDQAITDVDLRLIAKGPHAKSAASLIGTLPIDPGPWRLEAQVMGKTGTLRAEAIEFVSGDEDSVSLRVDGSIANVDSLTGSAGETLAGVRLKGHVTAVSTQRLAALFGKRIPDFGRVDGRFNVRGDKANWSIPKATVAITHPAGFELTVTGKASDLLQDARFDAELASRMPDPKHAAAAMGASLPVLPAISLDGNVQGSETQARFDGRIDVGTTPFTSALEVRFAVERPNLSGTLSTPVLRLTDFVSPNAVSDPPTIKPVPPDTTTAKRHTGWDRLLSDRPLGFKHLRHADVALEVVADRIEGERIRTGRLELNIEVKNGRLKVHHDKLNHGPGAISTALLIDNGTEPPRVTIQSRADNLSIGALYAQVHNRPALPNGDFSYHADLTGSGNSARALLATASGQLGHVLENATLAGRDLDTLNLGLLRLVMATVVSRDHTVIDCAISKFSVENGMATPEILFLHTPELIAAGTGQLNFPDQTLDIVVNTETKRLLLKRKSILRIHGPMRSPVVDTNLTSAGITAALQAAAIGTAVIALPPLGFSMAGLETLGEFIVDSKDQPCASGAVGDR